MIVCRQCGQQAREGVDFCESCGAYLEWEGEQVEPAAPTPSAPAAGPASAGAGAPPGPWIDLPPDGAPAWTGGPPRPDPGPGAGPVGAPAGAPLADVTPGGVPPGVGPPAAPPPAPLPPAGEGTPAGAAAPPTVMCLECGAKNTGDRRFCRRCGSSLELVALAGRSDTSAAPAPVATPEPGVGLQGPVAPAAPPATTAQPPGPPVPDAPRVIARAPAAPAAKGLQPTEAPLRRPPTRPAPATPDVASGGPICSQCGTANPPGRRFCRRCGAQVAANLPTGTGGRDAFRAGRPGLWDRIAARVRRRDPDEEGFSASQSARSAYRGSLDVRYRVLRVMALVVGVGIVAGSFGLTGINPVSGAKDLWTKVFPRDKRIGDLQPTADGPGPVDNDFPPGAAVDGDPSTAWAASWTLAPDSPAAPGCTEEPTTGGADAALVLTLREPSRLSKLSVQPGLPAGDPERAAQWKPTKLELRFDDGSCTQMSLRPEAGFQDHRIKSPVTRHLRIAILDAAAPTDQAAARGKVTIGEVRLYRPR